MIDITSRAVYGVDEIKVRFPSININNKCHYLYGEVYVFYSCNNLCLDPGIRCSLGSGMASIVNHVNTNLLNVLHNKSDSLSHNNHSNKFCANAKMQKRVTNSIYIDESQLVPVLENKNSKYGSSLFQCKQSKVCLMKHRVCDLVMDCGLNDESDEADCNNHFRCDGNRLLPLYTKYDNIQHCRDSSDKCASTCSNLRIINSPWLRVIVWIVGSIATVINLKIVLTNLKTVNLIKSRILFANKILAGSISLGDLCVGIYIVALAATDAYYKEGYCWIRHAWLSSLTCSVMGILNTAGNLISLLSMTFLGLYRLKVILRIKQRRKTRHKDIKLITMIVALVFIMSLTISIVPVIPLFNEYFINAYYYGNATVILVGAQDKKSHLKLISAFHGRTRLDNNWYSWALLQRLLFYNVFTSTKSITVRKIGFYGNDAVCIFKYIVTKEDDQKVFSLTVLGLHFGCLLAIVLSYMVIRRKTVKATRKFDRVLKKWYDEDRKEVKGGK